jgi:hypothetical protein
VNTDGLLMVGMDVNMEAMEARVVLSSEKYGRYQRIIWMRGLSADTDVNMEANKPRSSAHMDVSFLLNMDTQVVVEYGHAGHRWSTSADMDVLVIGRYGRVLAAQVVNTVIIATGVWILTWRNFLWRWWEGDLNLNLSFWHDDVWDDICECHSFWFTPVVLNAGRHRGIFHRSPSASLT